MTVRITSKKQVKDGFEIRKPYFNSTAKTVINDRYFIEDSFDEIIHRIDQWLSEGSGWIIDDVESFYINIANYEPLTGNSYILLPKELSNSRKGLINIKNKDLKCFMGCHVGLLHPPDGHPERVNEKDKKIALTLDYSGIDFPMKTHD